MLFPLFRRRSCYMHRGSLASSGAAQMNLLAFPEPAKNAPLLSSICPHRRPNRIDLLPRFIPVIQPDNNYNKRFI